LILAFCKNQDLTLPNMSERHLTRAELDAGLDMIRNSPKDDGSVELIVARPQPGARDVLEHALLDPAAGIVSDSWGLRVAEPDPATQLTIMNARVIALIAQDRARWPLAGDQLYVDLDLADENLPPGTQLEIGDALIEVSAEPHLGCGKFVARFGVDAMKFVNSPLGRQLHLRGINARVVRAGAVRVGDRARKKG
jgi:MOSC domain-containing protein YiiM